MALEFHRWPHAQSITCDHNTRLLTNCMYTYPSWAMPAVYDKEIVNCVLAPAEDRRILRIRLMVVYRVGTTHNSVRMRFAAIALNNGSVVTSIPTTPGALDLTNAQTYPLRVWQTVFDKSSAGAPTTINDKVYLGVIYAGMSGNKVVGTNDSEVRPLVEVTLEF